MATKQCVRCVILFLLRRVSGSIQNGRRSCLSPSGLTSLFTMDERATASFPPGIHTQILSLERSAADYRVLGVAGSHIETPNTAVSSADKVAGSKGVGGQQRVKGFCRIGSLSLSRDFHVMRSRTAVADTHRYSDSDTPRLSFFLCLSHVLRKHLFLATAT